VTTRYRLDPTHSRFTVQAFVAGMLSFLGHNPTFAVTDFSGDVMFEEAAPGEGASVRVAVRADSLRLMDKVSAADRRQIEETMQKETLETAAYPEIVFESAEVEVGPRRGDEMPVRIIAQLTLHRLTRPQQIDARLAL
jgi:polyisoprenoid-binding protein YceI